MYPHAMKHVQICVGGLVQGVGFRPFVYRLAFELGLDGMVGNTPEGVMIQAQGTATSVDEFVRRIQNEAPPLARIVDFSVAESPLCTMEPGFSIETSSAGGTGHAVLISPDVAVCPDCLRELFDTHNRRFLYPFINCTNCGPRFTITHSIPYDRAATSMACFPLCPDCAREYADPANRRFHAQPNACPVCGPLVWAHTPQKAVDFPDAAPGCFLDATVRNACAMHAAAQALVDGKIVAVRGLGGFHLACDARNPASLAELRRRKRRPHKSLAVMAQNMDAVRRMAVVTEAEAALLGSVLCPIVIVQQIPNSLPKLIAPDLDSIGVMLPSTPLHHVLLHAVTRISPATDALVMTSGNARGEPLCLGNREALAKLGDFADFFLLHNRDILVRADDSVVRVIDEKPLLYRRARGYTPSPLPLSRPRASGRSILGTGAHLKATLCCSRGDNAFVSQHVGDLENMAVGEFYAEACAHLLSLLEVEPQAVVCDLHPDYHSTRFARDFAEQRGISLMQVQHHVAHHHAVLGEHEHNGPALGIILDGTGYGQSVCSEKDGTGYGQNASIWGGELLLSSPHAETKRLGRLLPFSLPGGESAIREPWRLAVGLYPADIALPPHLQRYPQASAVRELSRSNACLCTSSCGRLFDAAAALLDLCSAITYEGQAAIRLEHAQNFSASTDFVVPIRENTLLELDTAALFAHLAALQPVVDTAVLARVFHVALMNGLCRMVRAAADQHNVTTVALGGGVFQNATLARELPAMLRSLGLTPLLPRLLPPGDGCISYGQVVWACQNG